jgi:hypothetical protein
MKSSARSVRVIRRFGVWWRIMVGLFRRSDSGQLLALTLTEPEEISRGIASGSKHFGRHRFVRWPHFSTEPRRR